MGCCGHAQVMTGVPMSKSCANVPLCLRLCAGTASRGKRLTRSYSFSSERRAFGCSDCTWLRSAPTSHAQTRRRVATYASSAARNPRTATRLSRRPASFGCRCRHVPLVCVSYVSLVCLLEVSHVCLLGVSLVCVSWGCLLGASHVSLVCAICAVRRQIQGRHRDGARRHGREHAEAAVHQAAGNVLSPGSMAWSCGYTHMAWSCAYTHMAWSCAHTRMAWSCAYTHMSWSRACTHMAWSCAYMPMAWSCAYTPISFLSIAVTICAHGPAVTTHAHVTVVISGAHDSVMAVCARDRTLVCSLGVHPGVEGIF